MTETKKTPDFAVHAGESDEQREEHIAALRTELEYAKSRTSEDAAAHVKAVEAEIARIRPAGKQTR